MKYLDLTLPTPALNLACEEALLNWCESGEGGELLRFWEPAKPFVVLGYANRAETEVDLAACRARGVPVMRRCTGGGAVLQGPGCLNYSLVLRIEANEALQSIPGTNRFIMERHATVLSKLTGRSVRVQGAVDLTVGACKSSGNAQRRRRTSLLFHGTFLLGLDLELLEAVLRMPSKQPDYRLGRGHGEFVRNLGLEREALKQALRFAWNAGEPLHEFPMDEVQRLAREKYSREEWSFKH